MMKIADIFKLVEAKYVPGRKEWIVVSRKPDSFEEAKDNAKRRNGQKDYVQIMWEDFISGETWDLAMKNLHKAEQEPELHWVIEDHQDAGWGIINNEDTEEWVAVNMEGFDYIRYAGFPL